MTTRTAATPDPAPGRAPNGDTRPAELLRARLGDRTTLVELVCKGPVRSNPGGAQRVTVRPVVIRDGLHLQFSEFDGRRDTARNYEGAEAEARLEAMIETPFGGFTLRTTEGDLHIRVTKKGKVLVQETPARSSAPPDLAHDRRKHAPLPTDADDSFLRAIGIADDRGRVRPGMHAKYAQVNEFLLQIEHAGVLDGDPRSPLRIIDCGCGSASLTFAAYHHLAHTLGRTVRVIGVDADADLIEKCIRLRDELGYAAVEFVRSLIRDFEPETAPDLVLALHACDTATDDALALAVRWGARAILAVPCCQHELTDRLGTPEAFRPVLRHGILRQRLADILTDGFRAQILRLLGYRTDVIEFISVEHTAKNLMIRAAAGAGPPDAATVRDYCEMKAFWSGVPYLEGLLASELAARGATDATP